jgi:hypothetical protein
LQLFHAYVHNKAKLKGFINLRINYDNAYFHVNQNEILRKYYISFKFAFIMLNGKMPTAKMSLKVGHQWLKPVILATWEAEIRKI